MGESPPKVKRQRKVFFDELREQAGAAGEMIHRISRFYLDFHLEVNGRRECPIHDSSAVAYLLDPSLFETQEAVVRVVTEGIAIGQTVFSPPNATYATSEWDDKPVVQICTSVDSGGLLDLYRKTLALASD